mgnify:CR=1 FL=1
MAKIDAFFQLMHEQGSSDLHLVSGQQPALRIRGEIERIKYNVLENDELKAMLYEIAPEHKIKQFEETGDIDFAYEIPGLARYRANFFQQKCRDSWKLRKKLLNKNGQLMKEWPFIQPKRFIQMRENKFK